MTPGDLTLAGTVRRGAFTADVDLRVGAGEVVALTGPNGSGKTTTLRTVAGLERLASGRLTLGDAVLDDGASSVPAERRRVATVFGDHRLFPHLSALENVAFGPRAAGVPRAEARHRAQTWLDRLGVGDLAGRRPAALSGGQSQRVALARALVADPAALVLDEPLAAVDPAARADVHRVLAEHLRSFPGPCLLVTHDAADAAALADRVVTLGGTHDAGRAGPDAGPTPVTTWYLEMTDPAQLRPGRVPPAEPTVLVAGRPAPELSRLFYGLVGADWSWTDRLGWTDEQWAAWVGRPGHHLATAWADGVPAGYYELDQVGADVELAYFGLAPGFLGRGLGGWWLTRALRHAWELPGARRVWVHTCTLDGPAALANYEARGLRRYREQTV